MPAQARWSIGGSVDKNGANVGRHCKMGGVSMQGWGNENGKAEERHHCEMGC